MSDTGLDRGGASSDIYTALTAIATLFVFIGGIYLAVKSQQLFGSWLPLGRG